MKAYGRNAAAAVLVVLAIAVLYNMANAQNARAVQSPRVSINWIGDVEIKTYPNLVDYLAEKGNLARRQDGAKLFAARDNPPTTTIVFPQIIFGTDSDSGTTYGSDSVYGNSTDMSAGIDMYWQDKDGTWRGMAAHAFCEGMDVGMSQGASVSLPPRAKSRTTRRLDGEVRIGTLVATIPVTASGSLGVTFMLTFQQLTPDGQIISDAPVRGADIGQSDGRASLPVRDLHSINSFTGFPISNPNEHEVVVRAQVRYNSGQEYGASS